MESVSHGLRDFDIFSYSMLLFCMHFTCCFRFLLGVVLFVLGLSAGVSPATFDGLRHVGTVTFFNHSVPVETLWPTILKSLQITKSKSD